MHIYICIPPFRSRVIYRTIIDSIRLSITHLFSKYCYISMKIVEMLIVEEKCGTKSLDERSRRRATCRVVRRWLACWLRTVPQPPPSLFLHRLLLRVSSRETSANNYESSTNITPVNLSAPVSRVSIAPLPFARQKKEKRSHLSNQHLQTMYPPCRNSFLNRTFSSPTNSSPLLSSPISRHRTNQFSIHRIIFLYRSHVKIHRSISLVPIHLSLKNQRSTIILRY